MVTRKRTKIQIPKYVLIDSEITLSSYLYLQDGFKSVDYFFGAQIQVRRFSKLENYFIQYLTDVFIGSLKSSLLLYVLLV